MAAELNLKFHIKQKYLRNFLFKCQKIINCFLKYHGKKHHLYAVWKSFETYFISYGAYNILENFETKSYFHSSPVVVWKYTFCTYVLNVKFSQKKLTIYSKARKRCWLWSSMK